jgi:hypothetical protein
MNKENLNSAEKTDNLIKEVFGDEVAPLKIVEEVDEKVTLRKAPEVEEESKVSTTTNEVTAPITEKGNTDVVVDTAIDQPKAAVKDAAKEECLFDFTSTFKANTKGRKGAKKKPVLSSVKKSDNPDDENNVPEDKTDDVN